MAKQSKKTKVSEHFTREELQCPCCGLYNIKNETIQLAEEIRHELGIPLVPESGSRCPKHNKDVGGKDDSSHLTGDAIDFKVLETYTKYRIVAAAIKCGAGGIGVGLNFVHVDTRPIGVCRLWTY